MQESKKILSGSALKLIAVIIMLIDHTACFLLASEPFFNQKLVINSKPYDFSLYIFLRAVGRLAFPIYGFLLTEGFQHTHDRKKYALNLLSFALISEIPWNLIHGGTLTYKTQNVFFTLFLGLLCIMIYETYQNDLKKQLLYLSGVAVFGLFLNADYGLKGVGFLFAMYLLRKKKIPQAFICTCFLSNTIPYTIGVACAFLPINLYNHERGFIKGKFWKYAFYAFYPVHMLILYFIKFHLL